MCETGANEPKNRRRSQAGGAALTLLLALIASVLQLTSAPAQDRPHPANTADTNAYTIAVHISSNKIAESGPEETEAIRAFVSQRAQRINAAGGIKGKPLNIHFYDDHSTAEKTGANVDATLADDNVIAMIGIWNSTRGSTVVDRIGKSNIPFVSEMSVETLFAKYPNIYTLTRSVRAEQEVFTHFARSKFNSMAFVGAGDDLYTRAFHGFLNEDGHEPKITSTFWLDGKVEDNLPAVDAAIEDIKTSGAEIIFLSIGSRRGAKFLKRAAAAGISKPVFVALGSISGILWNPEGKEYAGDIYEIAEGGIANLNNERLEQLMRQPDSSHVTSRYSPYAVGYGARYADLIAMIAAAANAAPDASPTPMDLRQVIARELASLSAGRRVWRGLAQDWSFSRERASAERSLLIWRPSGKEKTVLAPEQFVRVAGQMVTVPVLYVHLDMVRIYHVDSNDKSFEAEFFFTTRSQQEVPIEAIEFTNAYRGQATGTPLISIRQVHQDRADNLATGGTRIYKVSGRFMFEPDLRKYPFDEQIFSISFQPAKTSTAFFLQPPSEAVRNHSFDVDGWSVRNHYVGTNELIIRSVSGPLSQERVIPYYNFNYTWVMKRQVVDYVLRVIVPLSCILIVAYLAVFIPRAEFNAIIAIQVTALLSAIALYFALNQPNADDATLSDLIFVMAYAIISMMIALSIFAVNPTIGRKPWLVKTFYAIEVYIVPFFTFALLAYVIASATYDADLLQLAAHAWSWLDGK